MSNHKWVDNKILSKKQIDTRNIVDKYWATFNRPPTIAELKTDLGINSNSAIHNRLKGYGHRVRKLGKRGKQSGDCPTCGVKIAVSKWGIIRKYCSIRCSKIGSNNHNWKADDVGYNGLHVWVRRNIVKPIACQNCGSNKKLDAANISQQYKRDVSDWEWLCRKCHMTKDGRLKTFTKTFNNKK